MELLKLLAWLVALALVLGVALSFLSEWRVPGHPGEAVLPRAPSYELSHRCPRGNYTIVLDPLEIFTYYTVTIRDGEVVAEPGGPGTIVEAERVLSQYLDPELYYYYYAVLAGAASYAFDCYRVYYMHPLPMSEGDHEGLSRINITLCVPRRVITPLVEPRILAPEPFVLVNTSVQDPCTGEVLNTTTPLNIITYAPTATLNLTLNATTRGNITVVGYVEGEVWTVPVGEQLVEWCFYYEPANKTICYVDVYRVYNITYTYVLGYAVNGSLVADAYTFSLEYTVRDCGLETLNETCVEGGYFRGIGPLGRACVTTYKSGYTEVYENETHIVYTSQYYLDEAWVERWIRGLRIPRQVVFTVVQSSVNALSGVESTMEVVSRYSRLRLNETGVLFTTNISLYGAWEITEPLNLSDKVAICGGVGEDIKCINITRNVRFANVTISVTVEPPSDWGWGRVADAVLDYDYTVAYHSQGSISPDKWVRIKELLARSPGAWLEKLALRYIHDRLVEIIESTPMKTYRDAYLWLLTTQMPIAMRNCTAHNASTAPLLEALSDGCGCEEERVWILGNVTSYSLTVNTTTAQLMWPSLTNRTVVNATVVIAEIAGYPELWQLRNETLGLHLAKPVDGRYLVYYDVYENTVFCDWRRLLVHGR
ncbi:MAG: hypothetical protein LM590_10355 [Thermofilum sp.]|nr:hypothetical protein [Thermofilum sp.]